MQLLETELCSQLDALMRRYLTEGSSIPAFLAAATLQMYDERQRERLAAG